MKKIEICLTPKLIPLYESVGKVVVIVDIFRATSTMVTALANGIIGIKPIMDLETCKTMREKGYLIAGERDGKQAIGFDLGNSPLPFLGGNYHGKKLAMTTTNGTLAIDTVKESASQILMGAFINMDSTKAYLKDTKEDLLIYCAGWKGKFNLEDALYAGALANALKDQYTTDCDSTLAFRTLFQTQRNKLKEFLSQASHSKRLQNQDIEKDIDFCLSIDIYNTVAVMEDGLVISK